MIVKKVIGSLLLLCMVFPVQMLALGETDGYSPIMGAPGVVVAV